jgi:DNA-binding CsgD family transcriptional regulator
LFLSEILSMDPREEKPILDVQLDGMSENTRYGLLLLCLLNEKTELIYLSDLVDSPETIDNLMQHPAIHVKENRIWVDDVIKPMILSVFKWSEKVKASESLARYFDSKDLDNENLGDLWLMAADKGKALGAFEKAMEIFKDQQMHQDCKRVCEKILKIDILAEEQEVDILSTLTTCYICCGELNDAVNTRKKLLEKPSVRAGKERYGKMLRALAIDYSKLGIWSNYKKVREDAAKIFREAGLYEESALDFIGLANKAIDELNITKGMEYVDEALKDALLASKMELICKAKSIKAFSLALDGQYELSQILAKEALQDALNHNLLETAAYVYVKMGLAYEYASDFKQAKMVYNEAIQFCETQNMGPQAIACLCSFSWVLLRLGEWNHAMESSKTIHSDPNTNNTSKALTCCVMAIIKSSRGDIRTSEKLVREGMFLAQKEQNTLIYNLLHLPMAKINELQGDIEGASEWYRKIVDEWHQTGEKHDVLMSLMEAAMFFKEHNDISSLIKCTEIFSIISQETGNPEALGCMAFALGLHAALKNEPATALFHFGEARRKFIPLEIPYQLILVDYQMGKSHLANNEMNKGLEYLKNALPIAKRIGIAPMVSKIMLEVNLSQKLSDPKNRLLSDRQQDVLVLLNKGLSNKEIASALSLSTRTVDMHIRNLFDRLGCHSRFEAIEKGRKLGIV